MDVDVGDGEAMMGNKYAGHHADSAHDMARVLNVLAEAATFHVVVVAAAAVGDGDEDLWQ